MKKIILSPLISFILLLLLPLSNRSALAFDGPLRVNSQNPRYFTDNSGKSIFLTGTHTWRNFQAIGSDNFDYSAYLNFLASNNHNFMRLWIWETDKNAAGFGTKSVSPLPFEKQSKYDLSKFNQAFFDRVRQHVLDAKAKNIYVSIQLFNGWSVGPKNDGPDPWPNHPFYGANNVNSINPPSGVSIQTFPNPNSQITAFQEAYVRKMIDTVNDLDNVLFEICNESQGDTASINWQKHMIDVIHQYEATKPKQHPIGFTIPYPNGNNSVLFASNADFISPNDGSGYMTNPPANDGGKVVISDTDHLWGLGGNRSWAWKSFTRGLMMSYMDCYVEDSIGCPISQNNQERKSLIANMGYIKSYADKMALSELSPQSTLSSTGYALAKPGSEYLVYQPGSGGFSVNVASGTYYVEWLNPATGTKSTSASINGGRTLSFTPPFSGDAILYLKSNLSTTPFPDLLPGDINRDKSVNLLDYTLLSNAFGSNNVESDINKDGLVNILDYVVLSSDFGKSI